MHDFFINQDRIQSFIDDIPANIYLTDLSSRYLMVNRMFESLLKVPGKELLGKSPYEIFSQEDVANFYIQIVKVLEAGKPLTFEETISLRDGRVITLLTSKFLIMDKYRQVCSIVGITSDMREGEMEEEERQDLIQELSDSICKIRFTNNIISICSSCKKIRDDKGEWKKIDIFYTCNLYSAEFSHGLCPECIKKLYPEYYNDKINKFY